MGKQNKVRFELFHPEELAATIAETPVAYVPCGSLEWHGEHLPLGCDAMRGHKLCVEAAKRTGGVVLPGHYIAAPGYCAYGGSIVFTPATVKRVAHELCRELAKMGVKVIVLFLAHGGSPQRESFTEPAEEFMREHPDVKVLTIGGGEAAPKGRGSVGGGHAGPGETAECMGAAPDAVHLERFDASATALPRYEGLDPETYKEGLSAEAHEGLERHMARTQWDWDPELPVKATPEAAQQVVDTIAAGLAEKVEELLASVRGKE